MARVVIVLVALAALVPATGRAALINLVSTIDGAQANAGFGTGSPGTGSATMTLDTVSNLFSWNINWSGLVAPETIAHFHGPALPNQNAGVQVGFDHTTNPSIGNAVLVDFQEADLLAGLWYINIHTEAFPGGEIRGQVLAPEPASALLLAAGLALLIRWQTRSR